jgi:hypothetical protein
MGGTTAKNNITYVLDRVIRVSAMACISAIICIIFIGSVWTTSALEEDVARFNGLYDSRGIDDDGDGLSDHIDVDVGISIKKSGTYRVSGFLYDSKNNEIAPVSKSEYPLSFGAKTVTLRFYGTIQPGAYCLRNLTLSDDQEHILDHVEEAYTTRGYFNLDPDPQFAKLAGEYSDCGTDVDGDGKYDFLTVDVGINILYPGQYTLTGYLYDLQDSEIAWAIDNSIFEPGYRVMHLNFDGAPIARHGVDGPYRLGKLFLTGKNLRVKDVARYACNTSAYSYTDFSGYNLSEKENSLSGIGYGELLLTVVIRTVVPAHSGTYSYDLIGINVPPISTPWQVVSLNHSGYSYMLSSIYIPGKPNNFTVTADNVKNLNVGLKKLPVKGGITTTRIWVTAQSQADDNGRALAETDLLSPGNYHAKIFGDTAENVSQVDLTLTAVKKIFVNGSFNLMINTTGFPPGNYSFDVKALNGTFRLDEISVQG